MTLQPYDFSGFMEETPPRYKGRRISVYTMEVPTKAGEKHTYDWVYHPGAVVILPLLDNEQIILIENERVAVGKTLLEIPAGTLEKGEEPQQTAEREIEEETGYRADRLEPLLDFYSTPGFCNEILYAFVARGLHHVGQRLDPSERIVPVILPLSEAIEAIHQGKIIDGKTIATLLYFFTFGRSQ